MPPGVCPRRWMTSSVTSPTRMVSPCSTSRSMSTGSSGASSGCATVVALVALDHRRERLPVVAVTVRGDDRLEPVVADEHAEHLGLVGGVDQQLCPGASTAEQVAVVVVGAHRDLADDQCGQLTDVGRAPHDDVTGVAHERPPGRSGHTHAGATGSGVPSAVWTPWMGPPSSQASRSASVPTRSGPDRPDLPAPSGVGAPKDLDGHLASTAEEGGDLVKGAEGEGGRPVDRLVLGSEVDAVDLDLADPDRRRAPRRRSRRPEPSRSVRAPSGSSEPVEGEAQLLRGGARSATSSDQGRAARRSISAERSSGDAYIGVSTPDAAHRTRLSRP